MNVPLPSSQVIVFRTWKITPRSLWNPLPNVSFDVVPLVHTTLPSEVNSALRLELLHHSEGRGRG
jgi:hypothetical protein